jgi:hypothetical protein
MVNTLPHDLRRVAAFRLENQHITSPLTGDIAQAAVLGVQDTAPGTAALALALRRPGADLTMMGEAVAAGSLVPVWGPRLASHLIPAGEATMLTQSLLASDDKSLATQIPALAGLALRQKISLSALIDESSQRVHEILKDEPLTKSEIGERLNGHLPEGVSRWCDRCGREHPPEAFIRLLLWTGRARLEPDERTRKEVIAPQSLWRPREPEPAAGVAAQSAKLLRTFLHLYGPANATLLSGWAGIGIRHAQELWNSVQNELVDVNVNGEKLGLLPEDRDQFESTDIPAGIILLPAYDPFLQARDREVITADPVQQKQIWRFNVNPGVILENGELIGLWRPRRDAKRLKIEVNPYRTLTSGTQAAIEERAADLAGALGKTDVQLTVGAAPK